MWQQPFISTLIGQPPPTDSECSSFVAHRFLSPSGEKLHLLTSFLSLPLSDSPHPFLSLPPSQGLFPTIHTAREGERENERESVRQAKGRAEERVIFNGIWRLDV